MALLIVFSYLTSFPDEYRQKIPTVIFDLYYAYHYLKDIGWNDIYIVTDIPNNLNIKGLIKPITKGIVNADIITFISELNACYIDMDHLLLLIENIAQKHNRLFIYYSGHAYDSKLILPRLNLNKNETLESRHLIKHLSIHSSKDSQIFCVFDCCQLSNVGLPYKMKNDIYNLYDIDYLYPQEIICLTSSSEEALIVQYGSMFSYFLFKYLKKTNDLMKLLKKLNKTCSSLFDQTANIYSSYPDIKMIWGWIVGRSCQLTIKYDYIAKTIQINY